jgi:hypothetical protein
MGCNASKLRGCGSEVYGPPELQTSVASDLQQDPDAKKLHAGITVGNVSINRRFYPVHIPESGAILL